MPMHLHSNLLIFYLTHLLTMIWEPNTNHLQIYVYLLTDVKRMKAILTFLSSLSLSARSISWFPVGRLLNSNSSTSWNSTWATSFNFNSHLDTLILIDKSSSLSLSSVILISLFRFIIRCLFNYLNQATFSYTVREKDAPTGNTGSEAPWRNSFMERPWAIEWSTSSNHSSKLNDIRE